jgi:hypothetical protein
VSPIPSGVLAFGAVGLLLLLMRGSGSTRRVSSLSRLDPAFREKVLLLIADLERLGYEPWVYETYRSPARQAWLYASGRTREGPIVTNVLAPSPTGHGSGKAVDIIDGRAHPSRKGFKVGWGTWSGQAGDASAEEMADRFFAALGQRGQAAGLKWGGNWTLSGGGTDRPHIEAKS